MSGTVAVTASGGVKIPSTVLRWLVLASVIPSIASASAPVAAQRQQMSNPTMFEPEDGNKGFENARAPSDAVLDALLSTDEAKLDDSAPLDKQKARSYFEVVPIRLTSHDEEDYIALGKGPMIGADCFWFWVVRVRQGKAEVILFTNGLAIKVRHHVTNGYRDIEGAWASAAATEETVYRYDGYGYKLAWEHTNEIRP